MEESKQHRAQEERRQLGGPANGIGGHGTMGLGGGASGRKESGMVGRPPSRGSVRRLPAPKGKESKRPEGTEGGRAGARRQVHLPAETGARPAGGRGGQLSLFFFFFLKGFLKIKFYSLPARAGAETQRPLPLGPSGCGVPTITKEPTTPRRRLGVIPHREAADWRRGRPGRC